MFSLNSCIPVPVVSSEFSDIMHNTANDRSSLRHDGGYQMLFDAPVKNGKVAYLKKECYFFENGYVLSYKGYFADSLAFVG